MTEEAENYGAVLVDTSMFDGNALKLEKGLLGKLRQFRASEITYLLPDVIKKLVNLLVVDFGILEPDYSEFD